MPLSELKSIIRTSLLNRAEDCLVVPTPHRERVGRVNATAP
jgi:hypothetical protein